MPRNVVTLVPRRFALATRKNREARRVILSYLADRYRARVFENPERIEMDFPKRMEGRAAKEQIAAALDEVDPGWRRRYELYPTEDSLRVREWRGRHWG